MESVDLDALQADIRRLHLRAAALARRAEENRKRGLESNKEIDKGRAELRRIARDARARGW